jgi:hypothetical protein
VPVRVFPLLAGATELKLYGAPMPSAGGELVIVGTHGVVGRATLLSVRPSGDDCVTNLYDGEIATAPSRVAPAGTQDFVVQGVALGRRATVVVTSADPPDGVAIDPSTRAIGPQRVWASIDRDGDEAVDLLATGYACESSADPDAPIGSAGRSMSAACIDTWLLGEAGWNRVTHDVIHLCW